MRRPSFASTTRPAASIRSFAASAFVPNSFTTCPFTRTCPLRISSSACRREAIPARAIIFCNLSSMLSLVFSESCSFLCRCGLAPPVFLKQGALIRDRSVSLFLQPNVGRSNYCVNRKVDQPDYQPHDCEACRLRLNIKVGNEKKRTETENYRCDSNPRWPQNSQVWDPLQKFRKRQKRLPGPAMQTGRWSANTWSYNPRFCRAKLFSAHTTSLLLVLLYTPPPLRLSESRRSSPLASPHYSPPSLPTILPAPPFPHSPNSLSLTPRCSPRSSIHSPPARIPHRSPTPPAPAPQTPSISVTPPDRSTRTASKTLSTSCTKSAAPSLPSAPP